ncbi:hypothetical protein ACP275_08G244200 [Erythranthe tilingii]
MGRKIDMKKIEDVTKCQVTFSKRRSSLMKKANEIAVCCDIDVAFVAFSPSGRVSKFSNQKRIEDVLHRYVNLPAESRLNHISNVQSKIDKLRHLDHIKSDTNKLQYLDKQIENLELQIKKGSLEYQILEADLRDYEVDPEQEPSLHQLTWCERNINHSLERVLARKSELFGNPPIMRAKPNNPVDQMGFVNQEGVPFPSNFNENDVTLTAQNPSGRQILMQLDPWISPYSARVRESIFQDLLDHTKTTPNMDAGPSNLSNIPISSNMCNFPIANSSVVLDSGIMGISDTQNIPLSQVSQQQQQQQQPLMVNQNMLNFPEQNNLNSWNNFSSMIFPNTIDNSIHNNLSTMQPPRFTSNTIVTPNNADGVTNPQYDKMENNFQYATSNFNEVANVEGGEINMDYYVNNNINNNNFVGEGSSYMVPKEVISQDPIFDNQQQEDTTGDNTFWASKIQKTNLWEWEDLLLDENNYNMGGFSK